MAVLLSYALTTKADVKESLSIPSGVTTYDNLVIRKINQATRAIEAYCGRRFLETVYSDEQYNATQVDELVLKQRPVTATTPFTMSVRDTTLNEEDWDVVDSELYHVDNASGVVYLLFRAYGHWKRYKFTYSAGYDTIPEDLAEACASLACFYFNNADSTTVGLSEKREGMRMLKYTNTTQNFDEIIKSLGIDQILANYSNYPLNSDR